MFTTNGEFFHNLSSVGAGPDAPASIKRLGRLTANADQHRGAESAGADKTAFPRWSLGTSAKNSTDVIGTSALLY